MRKEQVIGWEKILLYFKLERKIGDDPFKENKKDKTIIKWLYISFRVIYP